jgi:hypothetical protein
MPWRNGSPDTSLPIAGGQKTAFVSDTMAIISWWSTEAASGRILLSPKGSTLGILSQGPAAQPYEHLVAAIGLTPSTNYDVTIFTTDAAGNTIAVQGATPNKIQPAK